MAKEKIKRKPTMLEAISVLLVMLVIFSGGVILGMNYVPLVMLVAVYAFFIGIRCGYTFDEIQQAVNKKIGKAVPVMSIFLGVGILLGGLEYCGTIPMLIYYGTKLISAKWIYLCAFILCAIFASLTGTSNGSVTTCGLAMVGIGQAMGAACNLPMLAGACVGGALFGDKLSPLSDTTIMAAAVTDNDVYDHMKHQALTVVPATLIMVIVYTVMGLTSKVDSFTSPETVALQESLAQMFDFNILMIVPVLIILAGALLKWPSAPTMMFAGIAGVVIGSLLNGMTLANGVKVIYEGFKVSMIPGSGDMTIAAAAKTVCERGGMTSMVKPFLTMWICYHFAGAAEAVGTLEVLVQGMSKLTKNRFSLIVVSGLSTIVLEALCGSSTPATSIAGPLFKERYTQMDLHTLNLARELEDFGTGATALIPWTSTGTLYATTLGMTPFEYMPYTWFIYTVWAIAIFYAITGFCTKKADGTWIRGGKK